MCISVKAPLDTKISDVVYEMSGIDEERHALIEAIDLWLELPGITKVAEGVRLPNRCPEPLCFGLKENPGIICLGPGCGTVRCKHPFHGRTEKRF